MMKTRSKTELLRRFGMDDFLADLHKWLIYVSEYKACWSAYNDTMKKGLEKLIKYVLV